MKKVLFIVTTAAILVVMLVAGSITVFHLFSRSVREEFRGAVEELGDPSKSSEKMYAVQTLVAKHDFQPGHVVKEADFEIGMAMVNQTNALVSPERMPTIVGMKLRYNVKEGEPIWRSYLEAQ